MLHGIPSLASKLTLESNNCGFPGRQIKLFVRMLLGHHSIRGIYKNSASYRAFYVEHKNYSDRTVGDANFLGRLLQASSHVNVQVLTNSLPVGSNTFIPRLTLDHFPNQSPNYILGDTNPI
jgi:hypothetical protein